MISKEIVSKPEIGDYLYMLGMEIKDGGLNNNFPVINSQYGDLFVGSLMNHMIADLTNNRENINTDAMNMTLTTYVEMLKEMKENN